MDSIISPSRPHLYHRASSKRPREESDSEDSDMTTANRKRALRIYQEQGTTSPPKVIRDGQPQGSSSSLSESSAPNRTNNLAGSSSRPTTTITQDRLVPVHPSVQFDAYNSKLEAGRDIGSRNVSQVVVGDHNRTTIYYATPEDEHKALLGTIEATLGKHIASDAVLSKTTHGEPSLCYGGTRGDLLEHILLWVEAESSQEAGVAGRSKCIIGAPGSGKSTIMNTMIVKLLNDAARRSPGLISAHYCIRRSLQSTTDWTNVLPTIISQLALGNLGVARRVHTLLADRQQTGVLAQDFLQHLFLKAISAHDRTVFVIIDALDEASSPAPLAATLSRVIRLSSPALRLLLASRNEPIVINSLDEDHILDSIRCIIPTEDSIRQVSDYIACRIRGGLRALFGRSSSWENWPSESQLQSLSDRADGLFIWATTATDFILSQIQNRGARNRDQMIRDVGNIGMANVNTLYMFILRNYLENDEDHSKEATLQWMKLVLGLIAVAKHPLTLNSIIGFLGAQPNDFDVHHFVLLNRSILVPGTKPIDESTTPGFHKTFFDFITTHRAGEFYINVEEHHGFAAEHAFVVMEKHLHFHICDSGSSLTEESLLEAKHKYKRSLEHVPDILIYASTLWSYHLEKAGQGFMVSNLGSVRTFLHDKLLFWLEIVILGDKFEEAGSWLSELGVRLRSYCNLAAFAFDAALLLTKFRRAIQYNIPHIYISLLTFSPQCSIVANHYRSKSISMVIPHPRQTVPPYDRWDDCPALFYDNSDNNASSIPVISSTHNVSHDNPAKSQIDKSPGGPVWSAVASVCFSPENERHLAVGYMDGSLSVWDVEVGNRVMDLTSDSAEISALCYSPNGSLLATSIGLGPKACVWNLQTGDMVLGPLKSQFLYGSLIAFSPDRTLFASKTPCERGIEVRDAHSGEILAGSVWDPSAMPKVVHIAYSPSATTIAAGSMDGHVRIWDVQSGRLVCWDKPHQSCINALSFSPNGRRLASASDGIIRILDTRTRIYPQHPLRGHTEVITSIDFSSDNCYLASGSEDRTIRIWDTKTGACVAGPIGGHSRGVSAVAFSPDGCFLASGSGDGIVRLWNVLALLLRNEQPEGKNASDAPNGLSLADQTVVDCEGWTLGPKGERLFWAPEPYNACIWRPSTVRILGRGLPTMIKPDLSKLITGREWEECFPSR